MISNNRRKISNSWNYRNEKDSVSVLVHLPHTNKEIPYNYFDEKDYQFISYYDKDIKPESKGKRYFMSFDGVMTAFTLYANDTCVGEYKGGYIPHHVELTKYIDCEKENPIKVVVDSTERNDIPPFGNVIDYLTFGGIYRDVWFYELEESFIKNAFLKYDVEKYNENCGTVKFTPEVIVDSLNAKELTVKIGIMDKVYEFATSVEKGETNIKFPAFTLENVNLWSVEFPNLCQCHIELVEAEKVIDESDIKIGCRHLVVDHKGLHLNGKDVKIRGLNRHQSFPYVGYAMPKSVQEKDARILKEELGVNTVRSSHYPPSPYFLDMCDEIGLLVMEEIPGWQYVSKDNEVWRGQVLRDVEGMIKRDWNHPSIFTWGVRINESLDDEELYTKTNALSRSIDPTRPTSGIRCFEKTQMLEDIYTMNDFTHTGDGDSNILRTRARCTGLENPVPYLVTEFGGHMYPTKRFDHEQRIVEQALIHGKVQSMAAQKDDIMGAIGWCAFDYNTHYDFGSGDRICYHGVMDSFRIPKFAAATYMSQKKPKDGFVLEPLTYWTRGEKNGGNVFPIHVFTNCDTIDIIVKDVSIGKLKRTNSNTDPLMQYLDYPPFVLDIKNSEWGDCWVGAKFIGYNDGKAVIEKTFCANPVYNDLLVTSDSDCILAGEYDATRLVIKAVDQEKGLLPFANDCIQIETVGDIEVVGPTTVTLIGGCIGAWVRTKVNASKGMAKVIVTSQRGYRKEIEIELC